MTKKEKIQAFIENYILLIPIIFAVAVIPTIVRVVFYDPNLSQYAWVPYVTQVYDLFSYYKNEAMLWLDGILIAAYVYLGIRKKLPLDLRFIPIVVYVIFLALSTIFSIVPYHSWKGFYERFETVHVLLGYCMICYYAAIVIRTKKQLKIVVSGFAIGFLVLTLIGASQFFDLNFYATELGKMLTIPEVYRESAGGIQPMFDEGKVYSSLANPNYVGVYCCMLCPLLIVFAFSSKKKWHMAVCLGMLTLAQICFVGASSKTTLLLMIPFLIFMGVYYGKNHMKSLILVYIFSVGMFVLINHYAGTAGNLVDKTLSSLDRVAYVESKDREFDIILEDNEYYVIYKDEVFVLSHQKGEENTLDLLMCDMEGNEIPLIFEAGKEETSYRLDGEDYKEISFIQGEDEVGNAGYYVTKGNARYFIYYSEDYQTYVYTNAYGRPTKLYASETFVSPVFSMFGGFSGRGYIWCKSVPLLKETLLIGSGPDTYAFMFPQYDYVSIVQSGYVGTLITKPHSMYLQIGTQTGVLSLLAFLLFNGWYFVESFKLYRGRKLDGFIERCGAAIFMAVAGYMCAGLFHDSTIGTSIVYWTLMGIGLACNRMISQPEDVCMLQEAEILQEG